MSNSEIAETFNKHFLAVAEHDGEQRNALQELYSLTLPVHCFPVSYQPTLAALMTLSRRT